ncbi:heme A synthase [Cypionkella sp.]|uniref:heme A synthase n=1 Tax=Cypionkella sp. TaxID=2811411 RepID=UPI002ABAFB85|nr:heme A synthase [Cypionkella sp.]MDZ4392180.1 COX15/CtaA family protein [Cypionkella sp.]
MATKRSIFEEVGAGGPVAAPQGGLIDGRGKGARRGIRVWLLVIFALVALMIVVGGLTRLTDSGLSITEWKPVTGAIPPLNDADWATEFAKYQASPEFQLQNTAMTLQEFKPIFWWEWGHRQLGRVIGLVWAVGFFGFLLARKIPVGWTKRLLGIGALGGLQGAIGWWMVSSGLTGAMVDVASYRLATHLGLAFVILGLIAWYVLLLGRSETDLLVARRGGERKLVVKASGLMHLAFVQILLGALVAGIDAGRAFPTWPDMNGQFFPADAFYVPDGAGGSLPVWHAFFENPGLVQFIHRMWGYLLLAYGILVWLRGRASGQYATRRAFHAVMVMLLAQVALGIFAALTAAQVHVAISHQIGAVVLWVLIIRARHLSMYPVAGSIREGTA